MKILVRFGLAVLVCCVVASASVATTRKVLFIGNSYTYVNNMPLMVKTMATALGDTLIYDESDPGGYTFSMHSSYAATIAKIFSQPWDVVVLQEQSQLPSFPPAEVDTEVYPYAHKLDSMIHANNSCTQTMFFMTWGHANGDPMNCASYPAICTYSGMQQRLRESYMQMALDNNAIVAPVGMAWKKVMDSIPSIWLFSADSSHPAMPGSYLETCVMYSSIFHRKTFGCTYTSGLATAVAQTLQQVSDRVVFDSLSLWQQHGHYPYAGFDYSHTGSTVTFTNHAPIPANDYWDFGDSANDTASNPVHPYTASGSYVVTHTVSTSCFTETLRDTVSFGTTGIGGSLNKTPNSVNVLQHGNGKITFAFPAPVYDMLEVYDMNGRLVRKYNVDIPTITDNFVPGVYLYRVTSMNKSLMLNGKMVVH